MRSISAVVVGVVTVATVCAASLTAACGSKDETPPANAPVPSAQPYGQPGYPQGAQTGYPQQGAQPGAPQQGMQPAAGGALSVPGPTALPCQNDSQCMTHKCNTQYGKCAFPCTSDNDCIQGSTCFVGGGALAACLPKPPGQ